MLSKQAAVDDRERIDDQVGMEHVARRTAVIGVEHEQLAVLLAKPDHARSQRAGTGPERMQLLECKRYVRVRNAGWREMRCPLDSLDGAKG